MNVLVTGGNAGIGYALCRQLAAENGCRVFMGSRNAERGAAAIDSLSAESLPEACRVELVQIDVSDGDSVAAAAEFVKSKLGDEKLYAVVNNAGIGLAAEATTEDVVNTNLYGPKRVFEAFQSLLQIDGRVVNVGSGSGPSYVKGLPQASQPKLCTEPESWAQIEMWLQDAQLGMGSPADRNGGYGLSKALLASYTMLLAKQHPSLLISCCTPGFIDTKLTAGFGATKTPEEGTVAIRHCLFDELDGNGYYYGSDGVRSPYHFMRNPGEPIYDGVPPS